MSKIADTMGDFKKHDVVGYGFAALVATGGIMGFVKKRLDIQQFELTFYLETFQL